MQQAITLDSFLAFLTYFGVGLAVLFAAAAIVLLVTPHSEIRLIRAGNTAAAIAFGGSLVGLALPVHSAISHSVSLLDAVIWGLVAAVVQVLAFLVARVASGTLSKQIDENVVSAGIFSAAIAISMGLVNAAAITP
jgi:putative membrane protein